MAVITDFKLNRGENTAVAIDPTELFCQISLLSTRKPVIHRARMTLAAPRGAEAAPLPPRHPHCYSSNTCGMWWRGGWQRVRWHPLTLAVANGSHRSQHNTLLFQRVPPATAANRGLPELRLETAFHLWVPGAAPLSPPPPLTRSTAIPGWDEGVAPSQPGHAAGPPHGTADPAPGLPPAPYPWPCCSFLPLARFFTSQTSDHRLGRGRCHRRASRGEGRVARQRRSPPWRRRRRPMLLRRRGGRAGRRCVEGGHLLSSPLPRLRGLSPLLAPPQWPLVGTLLRVARCWFYPDAEAACFPVSCPHWLVFSPLAPASVL